ncbi:phosphopentomutase [Blautia sp. 1033sp1_1033st1_G9_1033SCRN_220408]|uniref:phosphopentomutase n=1 Tax=Blautia sp. 1033sp1_1033st1_G9_1033SCRN_220408 TaxID=3144490 RepID=UPI0034A19E92
MRKYKRIFLVVIDSLGIGAMKDAAEYGDAGADTLGHIDQTVKELKLPAMEKLGLGNLCTLSHVAPSDHPLGYYARLNEASLGKDTMTGHWEMMGLHITTPFKTFTEHGFPPELIHELEERTGHKIVGNRSESGTKILDDLGEHQIRTGDMIVYTSADSVLQIAGHEETFGLDELYRCCEIAREITMKDEWKVGRVIARPYVGRKKGEFKRTPNRHDYAVSPFGKTALDILKDAGYDVISVGKIADIFNNQGITEKYHSDSSVQGMEQTIEIAKRDFHGLTFVNLVDFDALWGHRRNPEGYGSELEKFDEKLTQLLPLIRKDDLLMITADHGNDPTYTGTDHTREQTPLLIYSPGLKGGQLPVQDTFAVSGATILDNFGLSPAEGMIGHTLGGLLA